MANDIIFDVEQLCFQRLQQGKSRLTPSLYESLDATSLRKWLAVQLYSSEFSVTPTTRSESLCSIHLFDEAKEIISTVGVDYIVGTLLGGVFCSVPIIIQDVEGPFDTAIKACMYLNTSIHQSKVIKCPGFVVIVAGKQSKCISCEKDGTVIREVLI